MTQMYNIDGTGKGSGGGFSGGGKGGGGGSTKTPLGGSPGLLTSTGGLSGFTGALYVPTYDTVTKLFSFSIIDPSDFDCEEDGFYYFPEPDAPNGIGRKVSVHKLILVYREIGKATFTIGVEVYLSDTDEFKQVEQIVKIVPSKVKGRVFPDYKLHTRKISLVISGERPQPYITRKANTGPFAITKLVVCGKADEVDQL